jgi:tape measure domain-containing protein
MADTVTKIGITFETFGDAKIKKAFNNLGREVGVLKKNFGSLSDKSLRRVKQQLLGVNKATGNSINSMQAQKTALQGLRNMADVTGREFKELTRDIALLDQKMKQATAGGGAGGLKGRLKGLAKGAGAIAAGGIFGGPEGAVGGAIGLSMGGPAGAAVGAAIGAQVGMVRQQISSIAEYDAALELQRKALKLVINDTNQYTKSQQFLAETSQKLAIPQDVIVRQFTSLTASVKGAGKETADAEKVFKAIAAGIRGTGGSLEDMKAAMRATSQVFSKGKVSAEELRQQLGERLPGAFTLFAESMGKTPAELDKALEQGKVTLDDFMKFAEKLFSTYGKNAEILAQGPEAAGDRLKKEMSDLKDELGDLLRPIGAAFQTFAAQAVGAFNTVIKRVKKFQAELKEKTLRTTIDEAQRQINNIDARLKVLAKQDTEYANQLRRELIKNRAIQVGIKSSAQSELRNEFMPEDFTVGGNVYDGLTGQFKGTVSELSGDKPKTEQKELGGITLGAQKYFNTIKSFAEETGDAVAKAFQGMEDALVKFVMTGKLNFSDLARSILADMARIAIRQTILAPFSNFISGIFGGGSANGNVFAKNGIVPYRKGGIVNSPTMFQYGGSQLGIMGEAGPESIMPLKRGKDGKLGVIAHGGGAGNITVNVDASGSNVEGDEAEGKQLGLAISAAVQNEIIQQQRPGGLLA